MKLFDAFRGMFSAAKAEGVEFEDVPPDATPDQALNALIPPDPRVAALQSELAALQSQQRQTRAAAFADAQIAARRALPAERESIIALHSQAAADDAADAANATGRVARLEAAYAARPPHLLMTEQIGDDQLIVLLNGAAGQSDPAARRRQLLAMTPAGRAVLKQEAR